MKIWWLEAVHFRFCLSQYADVRTAPHGNPHRRRSDRAVLRHTDIRSELVGEAEVDRFSIEISERNLEILAAQIHHLIRKRLHHLSRKTNAQKYISPSANRLCGSIFLVGLILINIWLL